MKRSGDFVVLPQPFFEARGDGFGEEFEHGVLSQRKADERDEVTMPPSDA